MTGWLPWLAALVLTSGCGRTSQRCHDCSDEPSANGGTGAGGSSGGAPSAGTAPSGGQAQAGASLVSCNSPGLDSPLTRYSLIDLQWTLDDVLGEGENFPAGYELSRPTSHRSASLDFARKLAVLANARATAVVVDEAAFDLEGFVRSYGSRLYRRALSPEQLGGYLAQFEQRRQNESITEAAHALLLSMMLSPYFVFRIEQGGGVATVLEAPPSGAPLIRGTPLDAFEIAARLSHFTVRMAPDAELLTAATDRSLLQRATLEAHYQRLRVSPRAARARTLQYLEWLQLDDFGQVPGAEMDAQLARDLREQTSRFVSDLLAQAQAPLVQLLSSSRQPLSQRLADHYGVAADIGPDFMFVELDPELYAGVLGQGATLSRFRSPSQRGWFVQARFLSVEVPAPPGDHLFNLMEYDGETPAEKTRNATSQQAACRACHDLMDPMGSALQAFDELGRLTGFDSSGELRTSDGMSVAVKNPAELGKAIATSHAGGLGAAHAHLEHLLDRPTSSNDDTWAECLANAFADGEVELHALARYVALSEAARTMNRQPWNVVAASAAAESIEHAIDETTTLLNGLTDTIDRAKLEEYLAALRYLQQMPPF
jgi:hypothetical protein